MKKLARINSPRATLIAYAVSAFDKVLKLSPPDRLERHLVNDILNVTELVDVHWTPRQMRTLLRSTLACIPESEIQEYTDRVRHALAESLAEQDAAERDKVVFDVAATTIGRRQAEAFATEVMSAGPDVPPVVLALLEIGKRAPARTTALHDAAQALVLAERTGEPGFPIVVAGSIVYGDGHPFPQLHGWSLEGLARLVITSLAYAPEDDYQRMACEARRMHTWARTGGKVEGDEVCS